MLPTQEKSKESVAFKVLLTEQVCTRLLSSSHVSSTASAFISPPFFAGCCPQLKPKCDQVRQPQLGYKGLLRGGHFHASLRVCFMYIQLEYNIFSQGNFIFIYLYFPS